MDTEKRSKIQKELEKLIWTDDSMSFVSREHNAYRLAAKYVLGLEEATSEEQRAYNQERLEVLETLGGPCGGKNTYEIYLRTRPSLSTAQRIRWKDNRRKEYLDRIRRTDSIKEQERLWEAVERLDMSPDRRD